MKTTEPTNPDPTSTRESHVEVAHADKQNTSGPKPDSGTRVVAMLIDGVAAFILTAIPTIGTLMAAAYWLVRDGLNVPYMEGRSLGKHFMGLRPVRLDGKPMDIETSFWRNWMFALGGVVAFVNMLPFGWFFSLILAFPLAMIGLAILVYETYKVVTDEEGRRWGDALANTKVIKSDAKTG